MNYELAQDRYPGIFTARGRDQCCSTHFHKKIELLYNVSGEKTITVGSRKYCLRPDNLAVVDSYSLHHYEPSDSCQSLLILPVNNCEHYFAYRKKKLLASNVIDDAEFCKQNILPYFDRLLQYENLDPYTVQANVDMLLSAACYKIGLIESNGFVPDNIDSILAFIEQNFDKDISLTTLANHFGYSKYYFSRIFNSMFHTSLNDYLSVIRLQKTFQYLSEHKCSVTTAAFNSGFNSMPTFYRVLKKNYGEITLKQQR